MSITAPGPLGFDHRITNSRAAMVVLTAALSMFLTNGFVLIGITVFDPLILGHLHASVGALKIRDAVTMITAAALSPLSGYLLDRIGVRPIMAIGMIFLAVGLYAYPDATSLIEIYLIHVLFGCGLVTAGLFVCIILITGVTDQRRGLAVGVVLAGASLGSALSPKADVMLETALGWRNAMHAGALFPLLLIPIILFVVPKHKAPVAREAEAKLPFFGPTYGEALRTPSFWLLSIIAMASFFAMLGVITNLVLYVERQLGGSRDMASWALFMISIVALVVQLSAGALIDRIGVKPVHLVSIIAMGLGLAALALCPASYLLPAVTLIGIGWGGNYASIQVSTSKLFAGAAIGSILGTINIIEAAGAGLGPPGIGWLYDITHSYALPFGIAAVMVLVATIAVAFVRVPERALR